MSGQEETRPQGRHAGLTRERVLDAAMALVDRDGLGALSMRRLGNELGVEAMTLYHHVGSKEALLDGLVERLLADVVIELDGAPTWQETIRVFAYLLRDQLMAHPGLLSVVATRPAVTPETLAMLERALTALQPAGFAPDRGIDVVYSVIGLVLGHVGIVGTTTGSADRAQWLSKEELTDFPLLSEVFDAGGLGDMTRTFDIALEAMLAGFGQLPAEPGSGAGDTAPQQSF